MITTINIKMEILVAKAVDLIKNNNYINFWNSNLLSLASLNDLFQFIYLL